MNGLRLSIRLPENLSPGWGRGEERKSPARPEGHASKAPLFGRFKSPSIPYHMLGANAAPGISHAALRQ